LESARDGRQHRAAEVKKSMVTVVTLCAVPNHKLVPVICRMALIFFSEPLPLPARPATKHDLNALATGAVRLGARLEIGFRDL